MATVQKKTTRTTKKVTETKGQVQSQSTVTKSSQVSSQKTLTITKKGQFFSDSFFEDTRQDFQDAIKDVLTKCGDKSSTGDDITTYRSLRTRELKDENQAIKSTDDELYHKIVVDVNDFINGGEVSVKTVEEREVVVEGRVERKQGNTRSSKSFKRSFILPEDIEVEALTAVVSSDGVLIIKAPKKPSSATQSQISVKVQKQVQSSVTKETTGQAVDKTVSVKTENVQHTTKASQDNVVSQKVTQQVKTVRESTSTSDTASRPLTIVKKGLFFDDSFFEDSRQPFQTAIKQVLEKSNVTSTQVDDITNYRNLRQRDLKEENQAVTVSEDQQTHKIIVDVQDFINGGEVTVKTVDEREVVIQGHIEKQEGNTRSSKSFCKRFVLPEDIEVESVTSVVSSDGVLTIKAPRKPSALPLTSGGQAINIEKTETKKVVQKSTVTTTEGQEDVKEALVTPQQAPRVTQDITDKDQTVTTVTKQIKTVTDTTTSDTAGRPLPITKKGSFFEDSFFEDSRQLFQTAVRQVLEKSNETSQTDDITTYRNLRQRNLKEENQAVTVNEDQKTHKIIVDVQDFLNGGEVTVKTVDEREVVIEGHIEKQEGNTKSSKRFCKRFVLPEDIEVESVTSVVSSDGVLTITAPRKPSAVPVTDATKAVSIEKTETKKQIQTTVTTTEEQDVKEPQVIIQQVPQVTQDVTSQKDTEQEKTVTTVTKQVKTVTDTTTSDTASRPLPIVKKGSFFDDSFFEDSRELFQTAVRQVLEKSNVTSTQVDDITNYRNLRQRDLKEENQAVTVNEDQKTHKIIVDVQDFLNGGEVTVKTVDEREVVIEGHIEKQEGNTKSSKRFCKRFVLPEDIEVESVTSVVSSDGVLTITAPRKPSTKQIEGNIETTQTKKVVKTTTITTIEGEEDSEPAPVKPKEVVKKPDEHTVTQKVDKETVSTVSQLDKTVTDSTTTGTVTKVVTIIKKGSFFEDSFFEDSRQLFQTAVRKVLEKFNETSSQTDDITTYRKLRQRDLKEENQAVTVHEDQTSQKMIVDVQDFVNGGEVTVRTVNGREIVIEGHIERQEGNTKSSKRFCKRFVLAEDIDVESLTTVVSADGVLTITAPRKPSTKQIEGDTETTQIKKVVKTTTITTTEGEDSEPAPVKPKEVVKKPDEHIVTQKVDKETVSTVSQLDKTVTDSTTTGTVTKVVTIIKKGSFFEDSFFEDSRQLFQTAVRKVLEKFNETSSQTDDITTYRKLRQRDLREENQAVTVDENQTTQKMIVDVQDFVNGGEVTVRTVNEREVIIEGHIEKQEGNTKSSKRFCKRFVLSEDIDVESLTCVVSSDGVLTITALRKSGTKQIEGTTETTQNKKVVKTTITTTEGQDVSEPAPVRPKEVVKKSDENIVSQKTDQEKSVSTVTQQVKTVTDSTTTGVVTRILTIIRKGLFFTDSFFEETRKLFQTAVKQVLVKFHETSTQTDEITTYRSLRQRNLSEETQATTVHEDQQNHKIILDVQDFANGGEVTVKIVNEKEVVVEGHIVKQEATKRFCRKFVLPEGADAKSVSPVMSADGVLTIITKKKITITTTKKETSEKEVSVEKKTSKTVDRSTFNKVLTITVKGAFFSDTIFQDIRQEFDSSIKTVVEKFKIKTTSSEQFTAYRNFRKSNPKNENQAFAVKDTEDVWKAVIDVCDFVGGVKVQIIGGSEIKVEGRGNRQEGVSVVSFSFMRGFILPDDADLEAVSAVMSSEGILTIIAPKIK
ncbi:hypothetical protein OTU49_012763 [Cherax quadricarinatus]|uniref:SHSP domain-containing protein n=1 Tax=Cherax quadricarinatus TaxID=27406 RepID=A0AAW0YHF4_CHEQU